MPLGRDRPFDHIPDAGDLPADGGLVECTPTPDCRIADTAPPSETVGSPVGADAVLHANSWTFTALESDTEGRLYVFYWWVPPGELAEPDLAVEHLAWRTREPDATTWSEVHAVPGVTREDIEEARCASPSSLPVQFAATDDGYVHAFWRKNNSCRGGDIWYVEHTIFDEGEAVFRRQMPVQCSQGTDLRITDALARPDGEVLVASLCGFNGSVATFRCGCWGESTSVAGDDSPGVQNDLQLADLGGEAWIVVRSIENELYARAFADGSNDDAFLPISDGATAAGAPVPFSGGPDTLFVAWQPGAVPSESVLVARGGSEAFESAESLAPGGGFLVQALDGAFVPGRGPLLLTEESHAEAGEGGENTLVDEFFVRTFAEGAWSQGVLAASSNATFEGTIARHTASDLGAAGGRAFLAYVTYVGGSSLFELRVAEVP